MPKQPLFSDGSLCGYDQNALGQLFGTFSNIKARQCLCILNMDARKIGYRRNLSDFFFFNPLGFSETVSRDLAT